MDVEEDICSTLAQYLYTMPTSVPLLGQGEFNKGYKANGYDLLPPHDVLRIRQAVSPLCVVWKHIFPERS